jgi:hypothetical protein
MSIMFLSQLNNVKPLTRFCGILGTYFSIDMYALTGKAAAGKNAGKEFLGRMGKNDFYCTFAPNKIAGK